MNLIIKHFFIELLLILHIHLGSLIVPNQAFNLFLKLVIFKALMFPLHHLKLLFV